MILRILKKDLKRKKGMNIILLLFVILVTMFTSAGVSNVLTVMNGVDNFLNMSGVTDVALLALSGDEAEYASVLDNTPKIKNYTIEKGYFYEVTFEDGDERYSQLSAMLQSPSICKTKLYNGENNEITPPADGHIKVSYCLYDRWGLETGDIITITKQGREYTYEVEGWFKDAVLGSQFMGNKRFILSDNDLKNLFSDADEDVMTALIAMIETDEPAEVMSELAEKLQGASIFSRSTLKLCYIMDMLVAFIVLIASACLIIVSFIVLRFSIGFTISEEFKEIGVLKAIGIPHTRIRLIYVIKYVGIALAGCLVGFFISFPLVDVMLSSASNNMVLKSENPVAISLLSAVFVVLLITLFAWINTGKVKKSSPIDAIRNGETGERYKKKTVYHLGKSHTGTASYLALNDIISSPKRYLTVLLSFLLCTVLVLTLVITCDTVEGDGLNPLICGDHDLFSGYYVGISDNIHIYERALEYTEKDLESLGIPGRATCEIMFSPSYTANGTTQNSYFVYGLGSSADDYEYRHGSAPQNNREVAITEVKAEELGLEIGDMITVHYSSGDREYIISGTFDTLLNVGNSLRLHESDTAVLDEKVSGCMAVCIDFDDSPDDETIEERKTMLREYWDTVNVWNSEEFIESNIGSISGAISVAKNMLLLITLAVIIMVTLLMEKAFITHEKSQIAILKAIGFKNRRIVLWHGLRFIFVGVAASLLAAVISQPFTKLFITPIFATMGASGIDFNVKGISVFVIYPGAVLAVTATTAFIASLGTRRITSRDTASNE